MWVHASPGPPDDLRKKNRRRVAKCTESFAEQARFLVPLDVRDESNIAAVMERPGSELWQTRTSCCIRSPLRTGRT